MSSFPTQPTSQQTRRPTREEGLAIASRRKAARARRTSRIRKAVAVVAVAAFVGPFGFIYEHASSGKTPAVTTTQAVAMSASSGSTTTTASTSASTPTAVTTQQS